MIKATNGVSSPASPPAPSTPRFIPVAASSGVAKLGYGSLLLFLFLLFSRTCDLFLVGLHIPLISSTTAMVLAVLGGGLLAVFSNRVSIFLLAYSVWLTLTIPFAFWRGGSFEVVTDKWYKAFLAYILIVALVRTYDEAVRAVRCVAYALAVLAVFALTLGVKSEGRLLLPQGYFSNPNELGLAMLAGMFLWWFIAHDQRVEMPIRVVGVIMLPLMLYLLLETGSRSGLLCVLCVLPIVFSQYSAAGKAKFLIVVVGLGVVSMVLLPNLILHRFTTYFQGSDSADSQIQDEEAIGSSNQRLYLLRSSFAMTIRNPIFGVGPGNFVVVDAENTRSTGGHAGWAGTHNTYMEIASEAGIPALVFFVAAIVGCWRGLTNIRKLNKNGRHPRKREIDVLSIALKLILVVFSFQFFFIHMAYSAIFPAVAGLIVAVCSAAQTELARVNVATPIPAAAAPITTPGRATPVPAQVPVAAPLKVRFGRPRTY
jgi:O-antigen ligase